MTGFDRLFVWAGGGLFVASLATSAYSYFVSFGTPAAFAGWPPIAWNTAVFTVFAAHHSLFAREWTVAWLRAVPPRLRRSVYVWIASILLVLVCAAWRTVGGEVYRASGALIPVHAVVQLTGLWLIARAVAHIDPLDLAGIRHAARTEQTPLQVAGPYRLVRHPLYLGWMLVVFGAAHMTGDRLAFAAITSAYLVVAVPWEERALMQSFGEEYARYTRTVRWRVIPFVY